MPLTFPRPPHPWNLTPREAIRRQRQLAARVRMEPPDPPLRFLAGLDAAFAANGSVCVAAAVLWDQEQGVVIETRVARRPVRFPYVPGLLSFREAPALLAALRRLSRLPDALLCDGHGLAHPRRFGIACHLGVLTDLPSIGCAKSLLVGTFDPPGDQRGDRTILWLKNRPIGEVLRTQDHVRPVFVSVGHRVDQATATALVLASSRQHRLPEPTRLADRCVARERRMPMPGSTSHAPTAASLGAFGL